MNAMSDLGMRILCSLPRVPVGVTQNDIRADVAMDLGSSSDEKAPHIGAALREIENTVGLVRRRPTRKDGEKKNTMYGLPEHAWADAQAAGKAWWDINMCPSAAQ